MQGFKSPEAYKIVSPFPHNEEDDVSLLMNIIYTEHIHLYDML